MNLNISPGSHFLSDLIEITLQFISNVKNGGKEDIIEGYYSRESFKMWGEMMETFQGKGGQLHEAIPVC